VLRTKSIEQSIKDTEEPEHQLRRALGPIDLTVFGIGVIIGTGIFVLTGIAAATRAGPAIPLSFVAAAIACGLAALCYAGSPARCRSPAAPTPSRTLRSGS
jgi:APA family basic amino acid/polyamine antiporter